MLKISAKAFISGESCHSILSARGGLVQNPSEFPLGKGGAGGCFRNGQKNSSTFESVTNL
jgi:hypothetical protein